MLANLLALHPAVAAAGLLLILGVLYGLWKIAGWIVGIFL